MTVSQTKNSSDKKYVLNADEIRSFLPHRSPFLFLDRVLEIQNVGPETSMSQKDRIGTRVVALKNISISDPVFVGHFPTYAIYPGALIIEVMAQTMSFTLHSCKKQIQEKDYAFILTGVDEARFRKPVTPGDSMIVTATLTNGKGPLWYFDCEARVDGQLAAEAKLVASLVLRS